MKKKTKLLQVRITQEQYENFKLYAENKELAKSEIIRGFINRKVGKMKNESKLPV